MRKLAFSKKRVSIRAIADSRVNKREQNVRDDHAREHKRGKKHFICENEIYVLLQNRVVHKPPDSWIRENNFKDETSRKKARQKIRASSDVRIQRIAKSVVEINSPFAYAARAERENVWHSHLVEHRCANHSHRSAHSAQKRSEQRKENVMRVTEHEFRLCRLERKIGISSNWKPICEQCEKLEQNQKQHSRKRVEKKREKSYAHVEPCSGLARKINAERETQSRDQHERNQIQQDRIPDPRANQKSHGRARNQTHAQIVVDDDALEPFCVLHVKRLVDSQFRAQRRHLLFLKIVVAGGGFYSRPFALRASHDLLRHHLVNDVAGSERHQSEQRESQEEKQNQHRENSSRYERSERHFFLKLLPRKKNRCEQFIKKFHVNLV